MSTIRNGPVALRAVLMVVGIGLAVAASGCTSGGSAATSSPLASVSATAVLDTDSSTISFPLDKYGMSRVEQQIVAAGRGVAFYRCVTGNDELSVEAKAALRANLSSAQTIPDWIFGYWDADYLAKHGLDFDSETWLGLPPTGGTEEKEQECGFADESQALTPFDTTSASGAQAALVGATSAANDAAMNDERFGSVRKELAQCLARAGYDEDSGSQLGGVKLEDSWSAEERLKAAVTEATCNDDLHLTQTMADIQASYEQSYIEAHEAELVAIRKEAEQRVSKAKELLANAGLYAE